MKKLKLLTLLVASFVAASMWATSGTCGGGLSWDLTSNVLTITYDGSGTGIMTDFAATNQPWGNSNQRKITSITLPDGLVHIGKNAFNGCRSASLTSVTIPSSVTSIGDSAFLGTTYADINVPSGVTSIGDAAFKNCSRIASLTLPAGLTSLGKGAFGGCSKIASDITIPSSITAIPVDLFSGCRKITSITLHSGVTSIGEGAFMDCREITSVTIPAAVTEIGLMAFSNCSALASVTCEPTTAPTLIQFNAFTNCAEGLIITYPNGSDQDYANKFLPFWDNLRNALTSAKAPLPHTTGTAGSLTWDLSFTGSAETLIEHDGTLAITGTGAMADYDWMNNEWAPWFYVGDFINHVNIASGVTKIGEAAFANIEHVNTFIIPASVAYIGGDAFMGCNNPEMIVYCYPDPASLEWHDNTAEFEDLQFDPDDFLSLTRSAWGTYTWHVQATKCVVPEAYLEGYKTKWARGEASADHYLDVNVWFASEIQDGETESAISTKLTQLNGKTAPVVTLVRPLQRNGYFATICLPFSMTAAQIAESSLHSAEIKEFTNATVDGGTLNIEFSPVSAIEAGKPYFIKYTDPETLGDALDRIDFMDVVINNTTPTSVTHGGLTMTGTFVPKAVSAQESATDGEGVLFLGAENTLYWPNTAGNIKPFRAYFSISGGGPSYIRRGMPAQIVETDGTEGVDNTHSEKIAAKTVKNGMLVIEKNGMRYNAQGQIVK